MKNYKTSRIKHIGQLGTLTNDYDINGAPDYKFKSSNLPFWYGNFRVNASQSATTPIQNTKIIAVKHDFIQKNIDLFNKYSVIKLSDGVFTILDINSDDLVNGIDLLTIQRSLSSGVEQP